MADVTTVDTDRRSMLDALIILAQRRAVPGEPTEEQWLTKASDILRSMPAPDGPVQLLGYLGGLMSGAYRAGYWSAKVAECDPRTPGPPGLG